MVKPISGSIALAEDTVRVGAKVLMSPAKGAISGIHAIGAASDMVFNAYGKFENSFKADKKPKEEGSAIPSAKSASPEPMEAMPEMGEMPDNVIQMPTADIPEMPAEENQEESKPTAIAA